MRKSDVPRRCATCDDLTPHREPFPRALARWLRMDRGRWTCQRCEFRLLAAKKGTITFFAGGYVWRR